MNQITTRLLRQCVTVVYNIAQHNTVSGGPYNLSQQSRYSLLHSSSLTTTEIIISCLELDIWVRRCQQSSCHAMTRRDRDRKNQESEIREIEYFMCISVTSSGQLANPDLGIESINYIKLDRNFKQWRVVSRTTQ